MDQVSGTLTERAVKIRPGQPACGLPIICMTSRLAAVFLEGGMLRTFDEEGRPNRPFRRSRGDVLASAGALATPQAEDQAEGRPRAIWIEFK